MAEVVKGIVDIEINTGNAAAELKILQQQINSVFLSLNKNNIAGAAASEKYAASLSDAVNASRVFTAESVKMRTAAGALDDTLRKGQSTLGQYFSAKYVKNGALFAETLDLARQRSATLQTQFVATAAASKGMQNALAIKPLQAFVSEASIATERTRILSSMFRQGTTQLVNFGKNVQWAGLQLMVGFTVPLTIFGTTAGKIFRDLEMQTVAFKKVYGDLFTTPTELQSNLDAVKQLSKEFTKYGIAAKDTMSLAAQAAAAGRRNSDLTDAVTEATRLATLGQMDQNAALETTIALQSAFKLSGKDLSNTINYLNMVENQTVVSLQDIAAAIPRVAPVIEGLGGSVKDLTVFLAAMQEGGVSAEQGANALKSGLGSLINPSKAASEQLAQFGINLDAIVKTNQGDLMGTVTAFAQALSTLGEFQQQQALETVFGKYQYARLGALFENLIRDGSQARQVMDAAGYSVEQLAQTADKELNTIEQAFSVQLQSAVERFKLAIAPIGEIFVKLAIPIVNFATKIAESFNNLPDFAKKFIAFAAIITGLVIPAGTMFFGLLMNLTGTLAKLFQFMGAFSKGFAQGGIVGAFKNATQSAKYFSTSEIEAALAAQQLGTAAEFTNSALRQQVTDAMGAAGAVSYLSDSYNILIAKMAEAAGLAPFTMGVGQTASNLAKSGRSASGRIIRPPQMRNAGGEIFMSNGARVPGSGSSDVVPAMLTPGEFVINKNATRKNYSLIQAINESGKRYFDGDMVARNMAQSRQEADIFSGVSTAGQAVTRNIAGAGTKEYLKNFVFLFKGSINQGLRANRVSRFRGSEGQFGISPSEFMNEFLNPTISMGGKTAQYNPFVAIEQYAQTAGVPFGTNEKEAFVGSLRDRVRGLVSNARSEGKVIRIVDNDAFIRGDFARNDNIRYIKMSQLFDKSVMSNLQPRLVSMLNRFGAYRLSSGQANRTGGGAATKNLTQAMQALMYNKFIPGYQGRATKHKKPIANLFGMSSRDFGPNLQLTHAWSGIKRNAGGPIVPGSGNKDTVPALLRAGEFVVNKNATRNNMGILRSINNGSMSGYNMGGKVRGVQYAQEGTLMQRMRTRMSSGMLGSKGQAGLMGASFIAPMVGQMLQSSSSNFAQGIGKFLNVLTPAIFALSIFPQLIPKLMTGAGALVAGMALLGVTVYKVVEQMKKVRESGSELARAMYGSTTGVNNMAEAFGRQTATQQLTSLRAQRAGGGISAEAQQVSSQYMQTDSAKQLIADVQKVKAAGGDAIIALRNQLARSVMAGVITAEEARGVAVEIGNALNDQNLAVNVSGKLTQLLGQNGELIKNNTISIYASIIPKINTEEVKQNAEKLYEENTKGFLGSIGKIFDNKVLEIQKIAIKGLGTEAAEAAKIQREGVDALTLSYENGQISSTEYKNRLKELSDVAKQTADISLKAVAEQLGVTVDKLDQIENKQILITTKAGTRTMPTQQGQMFDAYKKQQQDAARIALSSLGIAENTTNEIIKGLSSAEAQQEVITLFQIAGGVMTRELAVRIAMIKKDFSLVHELLAPGIASGMLDKNGNLNPNYKPSTTDNIATPGPKTEIQLMRESAKQTREYAAALKVVRKEKVLNEQQLASMSAELTIEIAKSKNRNAVLKEYRELITNQNKIQQELLTNAEKELQVVDLQEKIYSRQLTMIDRRINAKQKESQAEQELNDVRQKALDNIAKEEEKINNAYNVRLEALDKVDQANQRNSSRQKTRIDLATSLAGGDIAGAARAASEITAQEAKYKLEDARATLEQQKQRSIDSITTMINGKLMTRKQIEDAIAVSNEKIYSISQQVNIIEKEKLSIFSLQEQSADRRFKLELEALAATTQNKDIWTEINRLAGEYNLAIANRPASDFTTITGGTNAPSQLSAAAASSVKKTNQTVVVKPSSAALTKAAQSQAKSGDLSSARYTALAAMYAKRKAFGGVMYRGSNEAPPAIKMAYGSLVPGMGNTDRVPALLTPGEFVIRKSVASAYMPLLEQLNGNVYPGGAMPKGSAKTNPNLYNNSYSINVNVAGTDASPDEIANAVMSKIKQVESRSLRGVRIV